MNRHLLPWYMLVSLGACAGLLAGCGGGASNPSARSGQAVVSVVWPTRSRLVPAASNSIRITFLNATTSVANQVMNRPSDGGETSAHFTDLPVRDLTVTAVACPNANGSGTPQAQASVPVTIQSGQVTPVTLTMANTIDHVEISPSAPSIPLLQSQILTMTARDAQGNVVLTWPANTHWTSDTPSVATIDSTGKVKAVALGTSTMTVMEAESGKTASLSVRVVASTAIYIADLANNRIVRMDDMTGTNWTTCYSTANTNTIAAPASVFLDTSGRIYAAEYQNHRIVRMDDMYGSGGIAIGSDGSGTGQFGLIGSVFLDKANRIYVCDKGNHRITRMDDMTGAGWTTIGSWGSGTHQFVAPTAVCVDANNRIYVADTNNNRIVRMDDMSGAGWITLGTQGNGVGQFQIPGGLAVTADGHIYVSDTGNHRIVRMDDMSGAGWTTLGIFGRDAQQFRYPYGLSVDKAGRIYVADNSNSRIVRMDDMTGSGWVSLGFQGAGTGQFYGPMGVYGP